MIHCIARPISDTEKCLLSSHEHEDLIIKTDDTPSKIEKIITAPKNGWTYDSLEKACNEYPTNFEPLTASLGNQWIGSTEV